MGNKAGRAYGLTLLCPIRQDDAEHDYSNITRNRLEQLPLNDSSPMARVPDTYLCRFYILNDIFYEGAPANEDHLKSNYLVFSCNFHGDRDTYLKNMWEAAEKHIRHIWEHCIAFEKVNNADDFIAYIKKCQVKNSLFFNGSNDDPLAEQLKSLYLKQEFTRFAYDHFGKSATELQEAFKQFINITQPDDLVSPSWEAGMPIEEPHHLYSYHLGNANGEPIQEEPIQDEPTREQPALREPTLGEPVQDEDNL